MAYNRSKRTIIRMHSFLDEMKNVAGTIFFPSPHPRRLAYKLREAMHAAQYHPDYQHLAHLKAFFSLEPLDDGVRARYLGEPRPGHDPLAVHLSIAKEHPGTFATREMPTRDHAAPPQPEKEPPPPTRMKLDNVTNLQQVVGAAIKYKNEADSIFFPYAVLAHEDKEKLFLWGQSSSWKFIDHEEDGITLTKDPDVDAELLWRPD